MLVNSCWRSVLLYAAWVVRCLVASSSLNKSVSQQQILDGLFTNYDKRIQPRSESGGPLHVGVDLFINSLTNVNELQMEYTVDVYMRQRWVDERLKFPQYFQFYNETMTFHHSSIKSLWLPDLFISNSKKGQRHDISTPNEAVWLKSDGSLIFSQRLSLTMTCNMDFHLYPGDNQTCELVSESYGYKTTDLIFTWFSPGVVFNKNITLPEFALDVDRVQLEDCTKEFSTGVFTCISVKFFLSRNIGFYMTQVYIPSILIVILSWLSFFIDVQAAPARVSIGLLTVLTITTQTAGVRSQLPRVAYTKAIDVWMAVCLVFVALAVFEYALAANTKKKIKVHHDTDTKNAGGETKHSTTDGSDNPSFEGDTHGLEDAMRLRRKNSIGSSRSSIDKRTTALTENGRHETIWRRILDRLLGNVDFYSVFLFPICFIIFNIIYWVVYFVRTD